MIATFFEWRIEPEREAAFHAAWAEVTHRLQAHGSRGSTLFRKDSGHYCALARWPDAATRDAAFALEAESAASKCLRATLATTLQQIDLDEVDNLWLD